MNDLKETSSRLEHCRNTVGAENAWDAGPVTLVLSLRVREMTPMTVYVYCTARARMAYKIMPTVP